MVNDPFHAHDAIAMNPFPDFKSRLEAAFANYLQGLVYGKIITNWWHEPIRLHLAPKTTYTPDFLAHARLTRLGVSGDVLTFYEVKGFRRDDAMVKLKVAARLYPCFRFVLVTRERRQWVEKVIG